MYNTCLLYTSDAADERSSVDLGGRRIIKKKKRYDKEHVSVINKKNKETQNPVRSSIEAKRSRKDQT